MRPSEGLFWVGNPVVAEILSHPHLPEPKVRELIALAQGGDIGARDEVVLRNMRLVSRIASSEFQAQMDGLGLEHGEALAEGAIALCHAVNGFHLNSKVMFSTYAAVVVRNALRDFCARGRQVYVNDYMAGIAKRVAEAEREFSEAGEPADVSDLARAAGTSVSNALSYRAVYGRLRSMDAPGLNGLFPDMACQNTHIDFFADMLVSDRMSIVRSAMGRVLDKRERVVLAGTMGLDDGKPKTFVEMGRKIGASRTTARNAHFSAIDKLRREVEAVAPEEFEP